MYIYTVKPGDTLFDIAQKNGVTISALVPRTSSATRISCL